MREQDLEFNPEYKYAKGGKISDETYREVYYAHLYPEYDSMEQVKRDVNRLMKRENISMEELLNEIPDQYAKGGRLNQEQKIYLKDLFYNVRDKEDNRIKKTFNKLDELGVSFRIQNEVIALAEESRTKNLNADDVTKLLSKYAKGGKTKKFPVAVKRRVDEINEMLPKVNESGDYASTYAGSTMESYIILDKPIQIKGNYVYISEEDSRWGKYGFEKRYNVNDTRDVYESIKGRKALMSDLGIIKRAFTKLLKSEGKMAKGGIAKKSEYISNRDIVSLTHKKGGTKKTLKGSQLVDGAYAKKKIMRKKPTKSDQLSLLNKGGEIVRAYDVNINSGVGTYARGGKMARGGKTYKDLSAKEKVELRKMQEAAIESYRKTQSKKMAKGGQLSWSYKEFKGDDALEKANKFIANNRNKYQTQLIFINDGFGVEYRPLRKMAVGGKTTMAGDTDFPSELLNYAKGGKTTGFENGELVWDSRNKTYGVVLNNYDNKDSEIRLDSDGNQPIEYLHKLNSKGDKGTKKDIVFALNQHKILVDEYDYEKVNYAKGGKVEIEKAKRKLREAKKTKISSAIDDASRELDRVSKKYGYYAKGGKVGDKVEIELTNGTTIKGKIERLNPLKLRTDATSTQVIPNALIKKIKVDYAKGGEVSNIDTIYVEGKYRDDGSDFYEDQETNDVGYVVEDFRNDDRGLSVYRIFIRFNDGTEREITKYDYAKGGQMKKPMIRYSGRR